MKKVDDKILSVIEKHRMISDGDTVVVAVSGGADSMCLLHYFNKISSKYRLNIICAHVNHGIRGEEADRDENFVRSFCLENNIDFECAYFDVPAISAQTGESEEQCGRRLRYEFFASLGKDVRIATAHNLNDCEETFLFNLSRGTGLKGLTGIPPVRDNIIRPLISCTREEIEAYLKFYQLNYVTDSTNLSDDYSRNRIRHNVIPVLCDLNSSFHSVFLSCISSLADAESFIDDAVKNAFDKAVCDNGFAIDVINTLHSAVRNRLILEICNHYGAYDVTSKHVCIINDFLLKGGAVMLPGDVTIVSDGRYISSRKILPEDAVICEIYSSDKEDYIFQGGTINVSYVDKSVINIYNNRKLSENGYADADKLKNAVFRSRKPGDRFTIPGCEHSRSLKNLFKERNITQEDRFGVPFLADDEGVLWINGIGVASRAAVDENTVNFVKITFEKG